MPRFDIDHSGRVPDLMITERTRKGLLLAILTPLVALALPTASALAAPPTVQITAPAGGSSINDRTPAFAGTAEAESEELLPGPEVQLNIYKGLSVEGKPLQEPSAQPASDGSWSTEPEPLADGVYTAQATQTNLVTGEGKSEPVTFTIDTVPPHVTLTSPANGGSTSNGLEQVGGAAGTAPGDDAAVTIELFAGAMSGSQPPLEMLTVPVSEGNWSASLGGLSPGGYSVEAVQQDAAGNVGTSAPVSFSDVTPAAVLPAASFTWVPANPTTGESVSLVSNSTDAASPISTFAWDVLGAGPFVVGAPVRTTSFSTAGHHVVRLQVTDGVGQSSVVAKTINVTNTPLTLMQPFPIVRIAGSVTASGARISLLTVQAPVAANVSVMCKGRGCRTKSESRLAVASNKQGIAAVLAFKRFERRLPAGVTLQIRVTKAGQIGKYTSFVIRRRKLPKRTDACVGPTNTTPIACPSS